MACGSIQPRATGGGGGGKGTASGANRILWREKKAQKLRYKREFASFKCIQKYRCLHHAGPCDMVHGARARAPSPTDVQADGGPLPHAGPPRLRPRPAGPE
eukprot:358961-Chlamydomonas_euryale.AAC.19